MIGFDVSPDMPELVWGMMSAVVQILFWAVVIMVVVKVLRRESPHGSAGAIGVLEERYARGEIDRDEFLQRKAVLEGRAS